MGNDGREEEENRMIEEAAEPANREAQEKEKTQVGVQYAAERAKTVAKIRARE